MDNIDRRKELNNVRPRFTIRIRYGLLDLCALSVIVWTITPVIGESAIFRGIALIGAILFLTNIIVSNDKELVSYTGVSLLMLLLLFFVILIGQGEAYFALTRVINLFFFVMLILICKYYHRYDKEKLFVYARIIIFIFSVVAVFSLIALQNNPFVLRRASGLTVRNGIERYAGAYGFAYGCVFLESFLIYEFRKSKRHGISRLVNIGLIVLFGVLIIQSGYTTAIVLTVVGVIAAVFVDKNPIITIIFTIIAGAILVAVVPEIIRFVINNFDIPLVYKQKIMILSKMTTSDSGFSYSDSTRGQLLQKSIEAIFRYPVLGSVLISGETASGGHQTLLDVLGNYGIVYALLYYYVIVYSIFKLMENDKAIQILYFIIAIILGFTNTYDFGTFIIPTFVGSYIALKNANPV